MKAGFAVTDITPELGIYLTGYGRPERLATNVHSPLLASAMYLADGDTEAAVVSLDWCFVDEVLSAEIQQGVTAATGIPGDHILLCCTHTHSAPNTTVAICKWRGAYDPDQTGAAYARASIPGIAEAVKKAKDSARPAAMAISAGKTETGVSRRSTHTTGRINLLLEDPHMIHDDYLTVARFVDVETQDTLGIFVHLSAHNTAMGITTDISSDWCGAMRDRLHTSRYPDIPIVFINGALGDSGPRTNRYMVDDDGTACGFSAGCGDGIYSVLEVGLRAATDVLRLLEAQRDFRTDLPLKILTHTITLPQAIHMSEAEAQEILARKPSPDECNMADMVVKAYQEPPRPERSFSQSIVVLGSLAIVPFPMEMFSIFSLRLRKYGKFEYTLCVSNVNGHLTYMPDRSAIAAGGYEYSCRKMINPYVFKPEAGDIAVEQSLKTLNQL